MTAPFAYPTAPHVRRHGPQGYAAYESYRPWLRDEFAFRCVYCLTRETWVRHKAAHAIDHFQPAAVRPELHVAYENLIYACITCNAIEGNQDIPDPLTVLLADAVRVGPDGTIQANTEDAARLIELLDLDNERTAEFREMWQDIIRLAGRYRPELYRKLMGFPDDLPDLSKLRPPSGNSRPDGVRQSYFRRRQSGHLPQLC